MEFGNRGRRVEVQFELPPKQAQAVLRASRKVTGVCYKPYTEAGSFPISTHLTWVTLPTT